MRDLRRLLKRLSKPGSLEVHRQGQALSKYEVEPGSLEVHRQVQALSQSEVELGSLEVHRQGQALLEVLRLEPRPVSSIAQP